METPMESGGTLHTHITKKKYECNECCFAVPCTADDKNKKCPLVSSYKPVWEKKQ